MKRTLNDTARRVRIVVDNYTTADDPQGNVWSAGASIDSKVVTYERMASSPQDVFVKMRVALEESGDLDDPVLPVPEKDYELLCTLLRNIASTWGDPRDVPDWRENEYLRGQLELVIETCRVVTDEEYERGDGDIDQQRDRITTWIEQEVWK